MHPFLRAVGVRLGQERLVVVAALLGTGGLVAYAGSGAVTIEPASAAQHIGQDVVVTGLARDVTKAQDGSLRFTLAWGGHGVPVTSRGGTVADGDAVAAEGRISDFQGLVRLHATDVRTVPAPPPQHVTGEALAAAPQAWTDRPLTVRGAADGPWLDLGRIRVLRDGAVPAGSHDFSGTLRYQDACLCYVFSVSEIRPWTP